MSSKSSTRKSGEGFWFATYNRIERKVAWGLIIFGGGIILLYALYELGKAAYETLQDFFANPSLEMFLGFAGILVVFGLLILFVSVIREKLYIRKHDPYLKEEK